MTTKRTDEDWAAIFDWDGVIVDSSHLHRKAWDDIAEEQGRFLPAGHFEKGFGRKNEQIIPEILGWAQDIATVRSIAARKEQLYRRRVINEGLPLLPGVLTWLECLAVADIPCVIGSSTERANIDVVLQQHQLAERFHDIVCADDVQIGKPAPDIFLKAAERVGHAPWRCVVFEDALVGIAAARAAGMCVVAVSSTNPRSALAGADRVVDRLDELDTGSIQQLLVR